MQSEYSIKISYSPRFLDWLAEQNLSFALTTYQAGKLLLIGRKSNESFSLFQRNLGRCMGLWADESSLYLSSLYQIFRFENALETQQQHDGYDCLYLPQMSYITGGLDIHDLTVDSTGKLIFVSTLFSCLATVSEKYSFIPLWQPPFISRLVAEDRCHLNGLGMRDGRPRYVTACSQTDVANGWRDNRQDGGCLIDINSNEVLIKGLSMPHSPRWYREKLWLLNSGQGEFGYVDLGQVVFVPLTFCPGYLRGLAFQNDYAIVGLSKLREDKSFSPLPFKEKFAYTYK